MLCVPLPCQIPACKKFSALSRSAVVSAISSFSAVLSLSFRGYFIPNIQLPSQQN